MTRQSKTRLAALLATMLASASPAHAADAEAEAFRDGFLAGSVAWSDVEARAREEGTVRLHYWGGSDVLNVWMDREVAPAMEARGITLEPVRITATKDTIDLVLAEKGAGRGLGEGSVDLVWVNGENFATLKDQGALFGGFAPLTPNAANIAFDPADARSGPNLRDFGVETGGAEMPWSGEQYVCAYNADRVDGADVPSTHEALAAWAEANPGKFTYVKPPHYIGNTFVQAAIYAMNPDGTGAEPFQSSLDDLGAKELARLIAPGIDYLRGIEPHLWSGGRYPEDNGALDGLFLNGEIDIACKFGLYAAAVDVATGTWPAGATQFVFPEGAMIKNKNYLAIPANAPNPAAAIVLADWMASVEAQVGKLRATGFPPGIDPFLLSEADAGALDEASPGFVGITQAELDANAAPDTNATLVDVIEAVWLDVIERDSEQTVEAIVERVVANLGG